VSAELEAKATKLRKMLDGLVQEKSLTTEQADFIHEEAIARQFNDVVFQTDDLISYTGWMVTRIIGLGEFWFSSWSGNFIMHGPVYTAIGAGFFPYARMEIQTSFDHDGATGYLLFFIVPAYMNFSFYADENHEIPIGNGKAGGVEIGGGTGPGSFSIGKS
jgi:hypothetical protein